MSYVDGRSQLSMKQQGYLYSWIEGKRFTDISWQKVYTKIRDTFDNGKVSDHGSGNRLVAKWCEKYGDISWPTEIIERD